MIKSKWICRTSYMSSVAYQTILLYDFLYSQQKFNWLKYKFSKIPNHGSQNEKKKIKTKIWLRSSNWIKKILKSAIYFYLDLCVCAWYYKLTHVLLGNHGFLSFLYTDNKYVFLRASSISACWSFVPLCCCYCSWDGYCCVAVYILVILVSFF